MIPYPSFQKIAFEIGPFDVWYFGTVSLKVHWYGIMYLVAFAAAWWLGRVRANKPGSTWKPADIDDFMFFGMLGTILGGRLGYVFFYGLSFWSTDPWYPFKVWDGGMSFHGGLLGVLIAFAIFAVRRKRRIADVFDFAAPLPGIGICAVRIGNFINGELWGKPTDVRWAFVVNDEARHATQLYEAALEGVLLFIILWIYTSKPRPRMAPTGLFLIIYSLARITVEFWRLPDSHLNESTGGYLIGHWFTMGMLLSIPMLLIGATLIFMAYRRREPSGNFAAAPA
ncbi:MAG TPA: prolipoprotein diacylglyceryl transferase [Steroidobacteraceae bacterium]|jgi:phosphatidylglycerol:prolipoprotein diacylglycerol transferase|nr:prolipoprotein diacylglyceryl transferase [Steroidobacteraceae bacterium]